MLQKLVSKQNIPRLVVKSLKTFSADERETIDKVEKMQQEAEMAAGVGFLLILYLYQQRR